MKSLLQTLSLTPEAWRVLLGSVGGYDLADHDPYADKDRAEHGVEPFEGHHL
jgi:hypothetical protein